MAHEDSMIADKVVSYAERLEDDDDLSFDNFDVLSAYGEVDLSDGALREVFAVVTTGGPHIEVALFAGRVDGSWAGDTHSAPIMDGETEDQLRQIGEVYELMWQDSILA